MSGAHYRSISSLTKGEARRLHGLNARLAEAESWLLARARKFLGSYYKICVPDAQIQTLLDAQVRCQRDGPRSAWVPPGASTVVLLDAAFLLAPHIRTVIPEWRETPFNDPVSLISDMQPCRLFWLLYQKVGNGDFSTLLEIGTVRTEISLRQVCAHE